MFAHWRPAITLFVLVAASSFPLQAQSTKAELFGTVRDPGNLSVNDAIVELTNTGTETKLSVATDINGNYHFFALPAGTYRISVAKEGFTTLRRDGIA
ncbi:MAG: carboxypeptidase regulatory-like domain-containing protein, partial [Candidatus Hydrogenedentes bacterium]|nr:carboxypeptidase regulatory-like domain-containing protein [Candidatus Hydrogenedentota bacterium]